MLRNIYLLSILLTFGVVSWIAFTVYFNITQSTIPEETSVQIIPITPSFDMETLRDLEARSRVEVDLSADAPLQDAIDEPPQIDGDITDPESPSISPTPPPLEEDISTVETLVPDSASASGEVIEEL